MKFAADGTLWCTVYGQGDVTVLDPDGRVLRRLPTHGSQPTNVAFGPPGSGRLYVTEVQRGQLEVHEVGVDGLALLA
jgi:gluconolactonase